MKHLQDLSICAKYVNVTDINSNSPSDTTPKATGAPKELRPDKEQSQNNGLSEDDDKILSLMELFYFAYRDFTTDGDEILAKIGFGRAHHRIIHFVHHYPGLRVADLLNILKITKQSLARVLKQLIDEGYICRHQGSKDRRERRLFITEQGRELAHRLATPQINRFTEALASLSAAEKQTIETFLYTLIEPHHRHEVITLLENNLSIKTKTDSPQNQEDPDHARPLR